jgi:hypothetical protein
MGFEPITLTPANELCDMLEIKKGVTAKGKAPWTHYENIGHAAYVIATKKQRLSRFNAATSVIDPEFSNKEHAYDPNPRIVWKWQHADRASDLA